MSAKFKVVSLGKLSGGPLETEQKEMTRVNAEVEVVQARCNTEDELIAAARDAQAILGGGRLFTRRVLKALSECRVIATYSVGFDGIDIDAASEYGIIVVNNPAYAWCVEEVSNHAITLLLACAKKLTIMNDLTKSGRWADARRELGPMGSIYGQTLGDHWLRKHRALNCQKSPVPGSPGFGQRSICRKNSGGRIRNYSGQSPAGAK